MNKFLWLSTPLFFIFSQSVFAACSSRPSQAFYSNSSSNISSFSYTQTFPSTVPQQMLGGCNPAIRINSYFHAVPGGTDLTGSSPFGVASTISISGSLADEATVTLAKAWLVSNLKIKFKMYDNSNNGSKAKDITALNTNYNILPTTGDGAIFNDGSEQFFNGGGGGTGGVDTRIGLDMSLINTTKPSAAIINALNGATIRILLGTYSYKYADYNAPGNVAYTTRSIQIIENLKLNFSFPTCTIANQTVTLAPVPTAILNNNQTANEQPFNVSINCTAAMPNKVLLASITDSYTPSNSNNNGILKNQPSLANASNVDVQLRDATTDIPLAIGAQSSFYSVPAESTAITFIKALKARYYRSTATATPGYVKTQATVSLDYQ